MTFPAPQNSPGSFAHTLIIRYREGITELSDGGGWIQSFPRVTRFEIRTCKNHHACFVASHHFSSPYPQFARSHRFRRLSG